MKIGNLKLKIVKRGFTLIEILIAIGIIVILTSLTIYGLTSARSRRSVKTTAEKLKTFLVEARGSATTPSATSFGLACMRVKYDKTNSLINVFEVKNNCDQSGLEAIKATSTFNIPKGISLTIPPPNQNGFSFSATEPTIGQIVEEKNIVITLSDAQNDKYQLTYQLTIDQITGLIEIK